MSVYLTATFSPKPGRTGAAVNYVTEAIGITRQHFPQATLWRTAVGGASTLELHLLAPAASFEESMGGLDALTGDAAWQAFVARNETNDSPFAERGKLVSSADVPGFDAPMIGLNTTGTPRAAGNAAYAPEPEAMEALMTIAAGARPYGAEHHVVSPVQAGVRPASVTSILLIESLRAGGAALDAMRTDPKVTDAARASARYLLGRVILQEILV